MPSFPPLKVALCQYAPRVGELQWNREEGVRQLNQAADKGAQLVVLPELASSGYTFQSEAEAAQAAESVDQSGAIEAWQEVCRQRSLHVVAGFAESSPQGRFNAAALLGPKGRVGLYRKAHLFNDEKSYFLPGDLGFPVFETPIGRVGILICYDLWFPEAARALALGGADLICAPSNWVSNFRVQAVDERGWTMGDYACVGIATQNQVCVVAADRTGEERGVKFVGCSCVVGADGRLLAGPASYDQSSILTATVDVDRIRKARQRTPRNHTFADRRPELYSDLSAPVPSSAS